MSTEMFRGIPLFDSLSDSELGEMQKLVEVRGGLKDQVLFNVGDESDAFYAISRGRVKITIPAAGTRRELSVFLAEGSFFGEMGVINSAPRNAMATVVEDAILLAIPKKAFDQLLAVEPEMSEKVLRVYNQRAAELNPKKKSKEVQKHHKTLVFYSPAGGAGTTFLACNLAKKIRDYTRKRTVVIDGDYQLGMTHVVFDHPRKTEMARLIRDAGGKLDSLTVSSSTVALLDDLDFVPAPAHIEESDLFSGEICKRLVAELGDTHDYVIVDTATNLSEVNLAFFDEADEIFVVIEPQLASMARLAAFFALLQKVNVDLGKVRLILNKSDRYGYSANDMANHTHQEIYATIPFERDKVLDCLNKSKLLVDHAPESEIGVALSNLARKICAGNIEEEEKKGGIFSLWGLLS